MADTRHKNLEWNIGAKGNGFTWDQVKAAVLMDIRDELRAINGKLNCWRIPRALDGMIEMGIKLRREKRNRRKKKQ